MPAKIIFVGVKKFIGVIVAVGEKGNGVVSIISVGRGELSAIGVANGIAVEYANVGTFGRSVN